MDGSTQVMIWELADEVVGARSHHSLFSAGNHERQPTFVYVMFFCWLHICRRHEVAYKNVKWPPQQPSCLWQCTLIMNLVQPKGRT